MPEAHLALPRPTPAAPATSADFPDQISIPDLALATAAYALETPLDAEVVGRCAAFLAARVAANGEAPPITDAAGQAAPTAPSSARFEAGMYAGLALLLAAPRAYSEQHQAVITRALTLTGGPYLAVGDAVRFGQFTLGDGTRLGDRNGDTALLMRETALAGLVLVAAAHARHDLSLLAAAARVLTGLMGRFRSPDGSLYAHVVTPGRMAGFGRDSEAEALTGLLCLALRADDQADELLESVEQYAAALLVERGQAQGYAQGDRWGIPALSLRASLLVAVFQRAAGRFGAARNTVRGLEPLRGVRGLLEGNAALTVAAEAALDYRYLTPWSRR